MRYMSDMPKAPGWLCCCRMLSRDLNWEWTPVSSSTSRTAVAAEGGEQDREFSFIKGGGRYIQTTDAAFRGVDHV